MHPQRYFSPSAAEDGASLAISGGRGGARLTHSHERQYAYVLQSLSLWREINTDMFKLWCLSEADLLSESNTYRLVNTGTNLLPLLPLANVTFTHMSGIGNPTLETLSGPCCLQSELHAVPPAPIATYVAAFERLTLCRLALAGQGMNRVQQAPNVSKAIHNILWRCQQKIGSWVGSSVRAAPALLVMYTFRRLCPSLWPQTGWPQPPTVMPMSQHPSLLSA